MQIGGDLGTEINELKLGLDPFHGLASLIECQLAIWIVANGWRECE
jgi:hypothetical protein